MLLGVALTSLIFSACSKSSSSSTTNTGGTTSAASTVNASCNAFTDANNIFGGRIATYYSGSSFVEDQLRVRVTNLSSSFDSGNYSLKFFRMKADASGYNLDSAPLTFTIYAGTQAISQPMTSITSATVQSLKSSSGVSSTSSSSSDFFNRTTIVVSGVDNSWQILKAALYTSDGRVATDANALMPLFAANPNTYASTHVSLLSNLHPLNSVASSNYSDAQYVNLTNQNCFQ